MDYPWIIVMGLIWIVIMIIRLTESVIVIVMIQYVPIIYDVP